MGAYVCTAAILALGGWVIATNPGAHSTLPAASPVATPNSIRVLDCLTQIAVVPFAGTGDLIRSLFETQNTIELGQPANGSRSYHSGLPARLAGVLAARPIAFTDRPPLVFHGGATSIPNIELNTVGKPARDSRQPAQKQARFTPYLQS